jgi:hypothetical protein
VANDGKEEPVIKQTGKATSNGGYESYRERRIELGIIEQRGLMWKEGDKKMRKCAV